jgi:SAM-dependent methyltransferase
MKITSTAICRLLNHCFPRAGTPALGQRRDHLAYAQWEFDNAGAALSEFSPHPDIRSKRILDVGCGLGGKSAWYALNGAKEVLAVDLDPERVERAAEFAARKKADNASFLVRDAGRLEEVEEGRFQMALLNDTFEHLERPAEALLECWRLLEPGGTLHIVFPPYGSPWGAHLFAYVRIPWAQLLFTDEPLLTVWKKGFHADAGGRKGLITPRKLEEVDAAGTVAQLRQLNKMTIRRFRALVDASPFTPVLIREHVPRWVLLRPKRSWTLRERLVTRITAVLEKREAV